MTVKLKKLKDYYGDNDYETTRMGFVSNDTFVTEPIMSECGRFEVNPIEYYGITGTQMYEIDKFNQQDPTCLTSAHG